MQKALEFSIKSITRKRQTEARIREKLAKRFPQADADQVVARLKELNYLNDEEFSAAWINYRSLSSPRGKYALKQELKRNGIKEKDMAKALEEYEEHHVLKELAAKKWEQIQKKGSKNNSSASMRGGHFSPFKGAGVGWAYRSKLQRFLLSRGFTISEVIEVVN